MHTGKSTPQNFSQIFVRLHTNAPGAQRQKNIRSIAHVGAHIKHQRVPLNLILVEFFKALKFFLLKPQQSLCSEDEGPEFMVPSNVGNEFWEFDLEVHFQVNSARASLESLAEFINKISVHSYENDTAVAIMISTQI